jgi:competence protein ComFC
MKAFLSLFKPNFALNYIVEIKELLLQLIYPNLCIVCENELINRQQSICHLCDQKLYYTSYENYTLPTKLDTLFYGRCILESSFSLLYFETNSSTQTILHHLKYKHRKSLAIEMGIKIGEKLKTKENFTSVEALIPVPIHAKKKFIRGYNQSELLAIGIQKHLDCKIDTNLIYRKTNSTSQTKKTIIERWKNVNQVFEIKNITIPYKHIALVDDVVTSGATLEAICSIIHRRNPKIKISIISLAITK